MPGTAVLSIEPSIGPRGVSSFIRERFEARPRTSPREVFGADLPKVSSTKSLTVHSQGATGVHEAIYSLIMMDQGFVAPSVNIEELDPEAGNFPLVRETEEATLNCVMSNSFGFGGTNASLTFSRFEG